MNIGKNMYVFESQLRIKSYALLGVDIWRRGQHLEQYSSSPHIPRGINYLNV